MRPKSLYGKILEHITIEAAGAEGNSIARWDGRVIFVKLAAPGDICDLKIIGSKKKFLLAEIIRIHKPSESRVDAFCTHFGTCGGCKWQHLDYEAQLTLKTQGVIDAFDRIGKLNYDYIPRALASEQQRFYRNKLEFTFSHSRWLEKADMERAEFVQKPGLGFHIPGRFDKIVHVEKCWLQEDTSNRIRNFCFIWAEENKLTYYDPRKKEGLLRNLMLRNTRKGDWMVLLTFHLDSEANEAMLQAIKDHFPEIRSLLFAVNDKVNDSIYDLDIQTFSGYDYLEEEMGNLKFKIRPKSFFQTNAFQSGTLYNTVMQFADFQGIEKVYDLYCGTGTISLIAAQKAREVIGVESVPQAINDARENAISNNLANAQFVVGDMKEVFTESFIQMHGKPDVLICDPPRAGMHKDVVRQIAQSGIPKVIYVSCNAATQARDLDLLRYHYQIERVQPVDMFPHTHHIENVVLLTAI